LSYVADLPVGKSGLPFSPIVEVLRGLVGEGSSAEATPPVLARLVPGSSVDAAANCQGSITMAANTSTGDPLNARMVVLLARCRALGMAVDCLRSSRSAQGRRWALVGRRISRQPATSIDVNV
jgi:hypothetical protein